MLWEKNVQQQQRKSLVAMNFIQTFCIFTSLAAGVLGSPRCDDLSWKSCPDDLLPVVLLLQEHKAYCKYTDCSSNPCPSDEDCVETINGFHCLARANPTTTDIVPRIVPTTTMTTTTTTMKDTTTALTTKDKQDSDVNQFPNLPLPPVFLVTDNITNIHVLSLSSPQSSEDLNTDSVGPRGVAYDPIEGKIFYGSSEGVEVGTIDPSGVAYDPKEGKILWRTLNGSQTGTVPNLSECFNVTSLAIDEEVRRLFVTCRRTSYIASVNLNGSQPHRIYLRNVYNVIVAGDAVITTNDSRKLLLASTWDGGIYHMELNGTDKQLVHAVKGKHLTITWDKECRRIFYAYRDAEFTIQVVDITGENHRILITHARLQIEGLAYYDGYVYWTNSNTNVRDYGTGIGKISSEANNTQYYEFYPQSWSGYEIIARGGK
ncbi:uncharacterized protein LOC105442991 [Strongylocentrotus purpuratus]|uniref:Uncharacterized protein n=1 Tax=Strongylocentrotus purpuratus TaxID=7668 RepID=A0A7M7NIV7_STRPU|nr:uncharacterized protein LOC105442991 [Strongylocentrotus purpuratus]